MIKLEQYHLRDEEWGAFSMLYKSIPQQVASTEFKNRFLDESLAYVIGAIIGIPHWNGAKERYQLWIIFVQWIVFEI